MGYEQSTNARGTAEQSIQERRYLKNVTTKTIDWYGHSFKAFEGCLDSLEALKTRIMKSEKRGGAIALRFDEVRSAKAKMTTAGKWAIAGAGYGALVLMGSSVVSDLILRPPLIK